jgi:hypothetical protein
VGPGKPGLPRRSGDPRGGGAAHPRRAAVARAGHRTGAGTGNALSILHGDRLVGKLDATADRKGGVFRVDAIHEDVPFTKAMTTAVRTEVKDLARPISGRHC